MISNPQLPPLPFYVQLYVLDQVMGYVDLGLGGRDALLQPLAEAIVP